MEEETRVTCSGIGGYNTYLQNFCWKAWEDHKIGFGGEGGTIKELEVWACLLLRVCYNELLLAWIVTVQETLADSASV